MFKYCKGLGMSAQPSCKSFQTVSESLEDTLTSAKLAFFRFIASYIEQQCLRKCDKITLIFVKVFINWCRLCATSVLNEMCEKCPLGSVIIRSCPLLIHPVSHGNEYR